MENNYTIKEVIEQRFDEMNEHLVEIKEQVKKTNGRVGILENHKSYLWGAISVLTFLAGAIMYLSVQAIDAKIKNGVDKALSEYAQE